MDMSTLGTTIKAMTSRLLLKQTFEFETKTSLEDCVQKIRSQHSEGLESSHFFNLGRAVNTTRTTYHVDISRLNNTQYTYQFIRIDRFRSSDNTESNGTRIMEMEGTLTAASSLGGTRVTGEIRFTWGVLVSLVVIISILMGMIASEKTPPFLIIAVILVIGYVTYTLLQDRNALLRWMHTL